MISQIGVTLPATIVARAEAVGASADAPPLISYSPGLRSMNPNHPEPSVLADATSELVAVL